MNTNTPSDNFTMIDIGALAEIMPIKDGESVKEWADRAENEGLINLNNVKRIATLNPVVW